MPVSAKEDEIEDMKADLDLVGIPPEVQEYAREKLGETPDTRVRTLQELRDMIYERGEVTPVRMDDAYLLRFLRSRSFKVESAYRLLVNYGLLKENNPEWWNINPLHLSFIGESDVVSVLPYRQDQRRTVIYKMGKWNPNDYPIDELFKATIAVLELGMLEPRAQILGGYVIWDLAGLSLHHAWHITPTVVSKVVEIMVTSFPMKVSAIHIVNESWVFDMVFNMFKPLLGRRYREIDKILLLSTLQFQGRLSVLSETGNMPFLSVLQRKRLDEVCQALRKGILAFPKDPVQNKRMFFHGEDMESLHAHIDPKCLPAIYGGSRPEFSYTEWFESLGKNPEIIREMTSIGYKDYGLLKDNEEAEASDVLSTTSTDSS